MNNPEGRRTPEDSERVHKTEMLRLLLPTFVTVYELQEARGAEKSAADTIKKVGAFFLDCVINASAISGIPLGVATRVSITWASTAAAKTIARRYK